MKIKKCQETWDLLREEKSAACLALRSLRLTSSCFEMAFLRGFRCSSLASSDDDSYFVPSLSNRSTSTTIELADGQTIGIAGLISENMRSVVNKFPGLGDLPILGVLFRDQAFEKGETELVIMVTPYLAHPINNKLVSLPTDNFVEPSDMEFYLLGKTYGKVGKGEQSGDAMILSETPESFIETDSGLSGGVEGKFGHSIE